MVAVKDGRDGGGEWVVCEASRGEGAFEAGVPPVVLEDLRCGSVGRRLVVEELAVKVGFFLAGLVVMI